MLNALSPEALQELTSILNEELKGFTDLQETPFNPTSLATRLAFWSINHSPEHLTFLLRKSHSRLQDDKMEEGKLPYVQAQEIVAGILKITRFRKSRLFHIQDLKFVLDKMGKMNSTTVEQYLDESVVSVFMKKEEGRRLFEKVDKELTKQTLDQIEKSQQKIILEEEVIQNFRKNMKDKFSTLIGMTNVLCSIQNSIWHIKENKDVSTKLKQLKRIAELIHLLIQYHDESFFLKLPSEKEAKKYIKETVLPILSRIDLLASNLKEFLTN